MARQIGIIAAITVVLAVALLLASDEEEEREKVPDPGPILVSRYEVERGHDLGR